MTRIYIFLLFCGVFTNVLSQPVDYTVRVIQTQWFENGVGGSCQEGGNEEYSARAWFHDNLNGTNVGGNCITCTNNGNCTNNTDFTLGSRSNTCASSVILRFQAWEDDRGGRCDLNINGGIFDNDDDCHCGASNVATINFRNNGPGCNTYGYYGCNQNNHRFLAEICWNYSAGAPTNTTCGNATTVGVGATAYTLPGTTCGTDITSCTTNDNDALWYAYTPQCSYSATFSTCTGSNYDTAISVWSACTSGQLACNDDACGVQSSVTLNVTEGTTYYIRVSGYNSASGNGTLTISAPPIPAVQGFGCNQWNVNVYNGNSTNLANNFFTGYYVENNLNYDSRNRWCSSCSPADASGYVGCNPGVDVHTVVSKRTCFPCGIWRIDVPNHDDGAYLFVNGSQVWSHSGCCDSHNNVWTGFLNNSSTVEFRHNEGGGGSHQGLRFTNVTPTLQGGSVSGNQTLCPGGNPPTITNTGTPSGGAGSLSYQWQQSVGCTGSWSNIGGATGLTYNPPALTQTTCYQRRVTDACGAVRYSNTITITVGDITPPTITCPASITQTADPGGCGATITYSITSSDNCPGESVSQTSGLPSGSVFPVGTTTNLFTVTDAAGNTATCSFNVTITDDEDPVITCPASVNQGVDPGICGAIVNYTVNSSDNCPGQAVIQLSGQASGTNFPIGTTTNSFQVTDVAGNTATCSFNVTIVDDEDPTITCPASVNQGVDPGICGAIVNYTVNSSDNCPGQAVVQLSGQASGTNFPIGTTTNSFQVTDVAGNTATCSFNVTITDDEDPVITCPASVNQGVDSGICGAIVNYTVNSSDNCPGQAVIQLSGQASGTNFPIGTTTNSFQVTDVAGNTATCSFNVTIVDDEDPVITCPASVNQGVDSGICGAIVNYTVNSSDNCPGQAVIQLSGQASGTNFPIGTTTNSFQVTDVAGNTATCSFNVTIVDDEDPTITCPASVNQGIDPGICGAIVNYTVNSSDNCPGQAVVQLSGQASGTNFPIGTTTNSFQVTDVAGNTATCSFNVTIVDDEDPTITCPASVNQGVDPGICGAIVNYTVNSSDNCPGQAVVQLSGQASGTNFPIGTTTNSFQVTDVAGNTATCSFNVTIVDDEDPTLSCPAPIVQPVDAGTCGSVVTYTVTSTDNCPGETIVQTSGILSGTIAPIGTITNTFLVTDLAGNTSTCSFDITVLDNEDPVLVCSPTVTIQLDPSNNAVVTINDLITSSSDNCGPPVVQITSGQTNYDCSDVGQSYALNLLATDASGNTTSCQSNVTVADDDNPCNIPPSAACKNLILNADNNCQRVVDASDFDDGSTDPEMGTLTFSVSPVGPYPLGTTNIVLTVTDPVGASDNCTATITVNDGTPPTVSCSSTITQNVDVGTCTSVVTYMVASGDNCLGETVTQTTGLASGMAFPVGTTTNTFLVTDLAGNTATCSFDVTITDSESPVAVCSGVVNQMTDPGNCTAIVNYTTPTFNDNCDGTGLAGTLTNGLVSGSNFPVGTTTVEYTYTDAAGNGPVVCSFDVIIQDEEPPVANCQNNVTLSLDAMGMVTLTTADINNGSTDNCNIATMMLDQTSFDCSDSGMSLVMLTVTDDSGNTATCSSTVTIDGTPIPTFDCPAPTLGICDGTFTCNFNDQNASTVNVVTASVSGSAAAYLQGDYSPGGNAFFDPQIMPANVPLTLVYTLSVGSCFTSTTTCTFTVVNTKQSSAGGF